MSSSTSTVEQTDSAPPAKKTKTATASLNSNAAAAAAGGDQKPVSAAAVDPALLARLMEEVGEKFVSKEEVGEKYVTKEEHTNLEKCHTNLKERLDNITDVFGPATQHALFETSVYEFVDPKIPADLKSDHQGKIKHGIVATCVDVMEILLSNASKKLNWQGPSTRTKHGKPAFPKKEKLPLVLGGLAGLAVYIKFEAEATLKQWDPSKRNSISHNGPLLDSLYASPGGNNRAQEYDATKEKVKTLRKAFQEEAAKGDFPVDIEEGISRVVAALGEKGIEINDPENKKTVLRDGFNAVVAV